MENPPLTPPPPQESIGRGYRFIWRLLLISNLALGVLGFKDISSSSVFIKVSMGGIQYQALDMGEFPLTSFRDNLNISLLDADGNQISNAGVRTVSIVEKGMWDDLFPLEGGGHIHMKLQFVLSDEERNRIHLMRESAMKRRREEILRNMPRNSETASVSVGSSLSLSSLRPIEVSDSKLSIGDVAVKAGHKSNYGSFNKDLESSDGIIKGGAIRRATTPNATDRMEKSSSSPTSEEIEVDQMALIENVEIQPPYFDDPVESILLREASEIKKKSDNSKPSNDEAEKPNKQEEFKAEIPVVKESEKTLRRAVSMILQEQAASLNVECSKSDIAEKIKSNKKLERSPSNIRKMISAFESSLFQDKGPHVKPLTLESQTSYRGGLVRQLKEQVLKDLTEKTGSNSDRVKSPAQPSLRALKHSFSTGDLRRNNKGFMKIGDFDQDVGGIEGPQQLTKPVKPKVLPKGIVASVRDKFSTPSKGVNPKEMTKLSKDLPRPTTLEAQRVISGSVLKERDPAGDLAVRSKLKSERQTVNLLERLHEEKESAGASLVKNEFKLTRQETDAKESVQSPEDLLKPSTLEAPRVVPGSVVKERNPAGNLSVRSELKSGKETEKLFERLHEEKQSAGRNELKSTHQEINEKESTLEAQRMVPGSVLKERDPSGDIAVRNQLESGKETEKLLGRSSDGKKYAATSLVKNELKFIHQETDAKESVQPSEDLMRLSPLEAATFSGRAHDERNTFLNLVAKHETKPTPRERHTRKETLSFSHENSSTWIFPDGNRRVCITADGDKVKDILGRRIVEEKSHQQKNIASLPGSIKKDKVQGGTNNEVTQGDKTSHTSRNSSSKDPPEDGSNRPLGQALKIALVVGFGILVILTRQRESRKENKKESDRRGSIEEQLRRIDILKLS